VAEIRRQEIGSVNVFSTRAEAVYEENVNAYVKMVLRRPFSKIIVSHRASLSRQVISVF
jgi:exocyst complex component 1